MDVTLALVVVTGIVFVLYLFCRQKSYLALSNKIPTLSVIRNVFSVLKDPHKQLTSWKEKYGDMYSFSLLNENFVTVSGYGGIYDVLVAKGKNFAGRPKVYRFDLVFHNARDIFSQSISPHWKKLHMFTCKQMKSQSKRLMEGEHMELVAASLVQDIEKQWSDGVLDPYNSINLFIAQDTSSVLTGLLLSETHPLVDKVMQMNQLFNKKLKLDNGMELDLVPWLRYFGNGSYKDLCELNHLKEEIYNDIKKLLHNENVSNDTHGLVPSFVSELQTNKHGFADDLDDEVIQAVLGNVVMTGISTSVNSLYAFLLIMASYPNIQEQIYEEIQCCLQSKNYQTATIELNDRPNMPFTSACLFELLRYTSIIPLVFHKAVSETELSGHTVPKNTTILVNLWNLFHDERYWVDPWQYKPNRFLDDSGNLVPSHHLNRKRLLTFGAGPRTCPGQTFATGRLFVLITHLIQEFRISPVPGSPVSYDPRCYEVGIGLVPPRQCLTFVKR